MKTGHPKCYIPSELTVLHDVWLVFARTQARVAKILKVSISVCIYSSQLNGLTRNIMANSISPQMLELHQTIMHLLHFHSTKSIRGCY